MVSGTTMGLSQLREFTGICGVMPPYHHDNLGSIFNQLPEVRLPLLGSPADRIENDQVGILQGQVG